MNGLAVPELHPDVPELPLLRHDVVTPLYQPIVDVGAVNRRATVAVEALARGPAGSPLESPIALFNAARRAGVVAQLDRLCIATALDSAQLLPPYLGVFLNVHPTTLCQDTGFPAFLAAVAAQNGIVPTRITLELLEHSRINGCECRQLRAAIAVLRGYGVCLAVDDVGDQLEDLRRALSLDPEYLKLDAAVVRGAQTDMKMRALLHAIAEQAAMAGARVIAEGIEDARDLALAATAGITLAQGYLLGRPTTPRSITCRQS